MASKKAASAPLNFEQAAARLDAIVSRVEQQETGLEEMISLVEEGLTLIRSSRKMLSEAELRIRKLEEEPAAAEAPAPRQQTTSPQDDEFSLI